MRGTSGRLRCDLRVGAPEAALLEAWLALDSDGIADAVVDRDAMNSETRLKISAATIPTSPCAEASRPSKSESLGAQGPRADRSSFAAVMVEAVAFELREEDRDVEVDEAGIPRTRGGPMSAHG